MGPTFTIALAALMLGAGTRAYASEAAPAVCGQEVAAIRDRGVVIAREGRTRSITLPWTPQLIGYSPDCRRLAVAAEEVSVVELSSGERIDLGAPPAPLQVNSHVPIAWSPSGARFAVPFYIEDLRRQSALSIYDPAAKTSARVALPSGTLKSFELESEDRARVAISIDSAWWPVSLLRATTSAWERVGHASYKDLIVRSGSIVGRSDADVLVAIDAATGAERELARGVRVLLDVSRDGRAALGEVADSTVEGFHAVRFPLDGGAPLHFGLRGIQVAAFSVDGMVLVCHPSGAQGQALVRDDGNGHARMIFNEGLRAGGVSHFELSADGSFIAILFRRLGPRIRGCGFYQSYYFRRELIVRDLRGSKRSSKTFLGQQEGMCALE